MESMEPFGLEEDASLFLNGPGFNVFKEWAQAVSRDPHRHGFECFSGAEATHPPPVASYLDESRPQTKKPRIQEEEEQECTSKQPTWTSKSYCMFCNKGQQKLEVHFGMVHN